MPKNEIIKLLEQIVDKKSNQTLKELEAIKRVSILTNKVVDVEIILPSLDNADEIKRGIAKIVKLDFPNTCRFVVCYHFCRHVVQVHLSSEFFLTYLD